MYHVPKKNHLICYCTLLAILIFVSTNVFTDRGAQFQYAWLSVVALMPSLCVCPYAPYEKGIDCVLRDAAALQLRDPQVILGADWFLQVPAGSEADRGAAPDRPPRRRALDAPKNSCGCSGAASGPHAYDG